MAAVSLADGYGRHSREVGDDDGGHATVSEVGDEPSSVSGDSTLFSTVHAQVMAVRAEVPYVVSRKVRCHSAMLPL